MKSIEEKKRLRFEFLKKVHDKTDGFKFDLVNVEDIGKELGLDRDSAWALAYYLDDEGLLKIESNMEVSIAHAGIVEIEEALSDPKKPTEHFLPVNIIYANTITDASIQQGGSRNIQITEYRREDLQALSGTIDSILRDLTSLDLQPDDAQQMKADLEAARAQVTSPKPKHNVIRMCLESAVEILKGVGTTLAEQYVKKLLSLLQ